jgi:hypothetical protein
VGSGVGVGVGMGVEASAQAEQSSKKMIRAKSIKPGWSDKFLMPKFRDKV